MLSQHPDIHRRLREEVLSTVGSRRPTYDDIRDMKEILQEADYHELLIAFSRCRYGDIRELKCLDVAAVWRRQPALLRLQLEILYD